MYFLFLKKNTMTNHVSFSLMPVFSLKQVLNIALSENSKFKNFGQRHDTEFWFSPIYSPGYCPKTGIFNSI